MKPTLQPVWDLPLRLFHWLLVGLLAFSWWSGENHEMEWHRWSGYAILFLLVFRLYWGLVGGTTARFAHFVRGPRAAYAYLRGLERPDIGHNPLGGWSVLAILIVMVTAGLFAVDVDGLESGPLADYVSFDAGRWASDMHSLIFNLLLGLIALHVAAILFYQVARRRNLIGPMITGGTTTIDGSTAVPLGTSAWRALIGLLIAAAVTYFVSEGLHF
ncbi:cytochrome b/b6 domain-containing protein [Sphingobium olei]|uniref:Cytochrome b/b6 domain-containing protein n=1 Tax=Sphingobium olei TaxID=420955 RepID=A0ABW3P535_9SPHN